MDFIINELGTSRDIERYEPTALPGAELKQGKELSEAVNSHRGDRFGLNSHWGRNFGTIPVESDITLPDSRKGDSYEDAGCGFVHPECRHTFLVPGARTTRVANRHLAEDACPVPRRLLPATEQNERSSPPTTNR
jgi:hypothetical protein